MLYSHIIHIHLHAEHTNTIKTSDTVLRKIYLSLYWKGWVWEGVGDRTELQHIDPHSIGHNHVSFSFSWAAQPGAWGGAASLGAGFLYRILSPAHLIPNWSDLQSATAQSGVWGLPLLGAGFLYHSLSPTDWISCALSYIIVQHPPSYCGCHKLHSFNPSTVKVILGYSSTGCTCYLHR